MTKTLTEQWRERTLPDGYYYVTSKKWGMLIDRYRDQINDCGHKWRGFDNCQGIVDEVIAPVPSYKALYGPNDGNMPTGVFTILKIIKRDIDNAQKRRSLTDLECGIKSQVVSLLKKWGVE